MKQVKKQLNESNSMSNPEKTLRKTCEERARKSGFIMVKMENTGHIGMPDNIIIHPSGIFLLVEFKRPDGAGVVSTEQMLWLEYFSASDCCGSRHAVVVESEVEFCEAIKSVFGEDI